LKTPSIVSREIEVLQQLRSRFVAELIEVIPALENLQAEREANLVFEYLPHDLQGLLAVRDSPFDVTAKKYTCRQILEAIDFVHRKGYLHRDIKRGSNIIFSDCGFLKVPPPGALQLPTY
jgi:CTD kinase subunit alpha